MYVPIFRYTTTHQICTLSNIGDLRDGFGIRVDVELEYFWAIVHQRLNPFVQVGDFIQAHLEHDSAERLPAVCPFLLQELAHDSHQFHFLFLIGGNLLRKSLEMYTNPVRTEVRPVGCWK